MKKALIIVFILALAACSASENKGWVTYGGDGTRSLVASRLGPSRGRLLWVVNLQTTDPGSPVADSHGNIYVPHSGGSLTKVDSSGEMSWRYDSWVSQEGVRSPLAVVQPGGQILISCFHQQQTLRVSPDGQELALEQWLPWPAANSPAVSSQGYTVACHQYVTGANSVGLRLFGVSKGGASDWSLDYQGSGAVWSGSIPVLAEDGTALVFIEETGPGDNYLVSISPQGELNWQTAFLGVETTAVGSAIAVTHDGTIYFGTARVEDISALHSPGWVYSVDSTGQMRWRVDAGQRVVQLMVNSEMVVANVLRTRLLALDSRGRELWRHNFEGWESNCVMDSRGNVYVVGVKSGTVHTKSVSSKGKLRWESDTGQRAASVSFMALDRGVLYITTDTGLLLAVGE